MALPRRIDCRPGHRKANMGPARHAHAPSPAKSPQQTTQCRACAQRKRGVKG
jgi:hypothetical protein